MPGQEQDQQYSMALVPINLQQLKLSQTFVHLIPGNPALLVGSFAARVVPQPHLDKFVHISPGLNLMSNLRA